RHSTPDGDSRVMRRTIAQKLLADARVDAVSADQRARRPASTARCLHAHAVRALLEAGHLGAEDDLSVLTHGGEQQLVEFGPMDRQRRGAVARLEACALPRQEELAL